MGVPATLEAAAHILTSPEVDLEFAQDFMAMLDNNLTDTKAQGFWREDSGLDGS
ncbi:hypothetical protein ABZZ80_32405 [Streptomyces sp. NPDC006356]